MIVCLLQNSLYFLSMTARQNVYFFIPLPYILVGHWSVTSDCAAEEGLGIRARGV